MCVCGDPDPENLIRPPTKTKIEDGSESAVRRDWQRICHPVLRHVRRSDAAAKPGQPVQRKCGCGGVGFRLEPVGNPVELGSSFPLSDKWS